MKWLIEKEIKLLKYLSMALIKRIVKKLGYCYNETTIGQNVKQVLSKM